MIYEMRTAATIAECLARAENETERTLIAIQVGSHDLLDISPWPVSIGLNVDHELDPSRDLWVQSEEWLRELSRECAAAADGIRNARP